MQWQQRACVYRQGMCQLFVVLSYLTNFVVVVVKRNLLLVGTMKKNASKRVGKMLHASLAA